MRLKWKIVLAILLVFPIYRAASLLMAGNIQEYELLLVAGNLTFFFFVLNAGTCYYFRQFSAGPSTKICRVENGCAACQPEGLLEKSHRLFFWPLFFLGIFHFYLALNLGFISPSNAFFSFIAVLFGLFLYLWLLSCRYFKFFFMQQTAAFSAKKIPGKIMHKIYGVVKKLHLHHETFFWLALFFLVLHLVSILLNRI